MPHCRATVQTDNTTTKNGNYTFKNGIFDNKILKDYNRN